MKTGIVVLADFDLVNSTVRRVRMIAKSLAAIGHDVHVVIPQRFRRGCLTEQSDGLTLHWGTATSSTQWRTTGERLRARWATIRLVDALCREGLDWLILYNLGVEALPLLAAAHRCGTRVAAEYCDARVQPTNPSMEDRVRTVWHRVADALVPRRTDLNLGISHYLVDWLRAKAPSTPVLLVPPVVDTDAFYPRPREAQEFRRQWTIDDEPVIAYLGSYWKVEGVATLLRAASELASARERFKVVLSGAEVPGRDCDDVPGLTAAFGLQQHVVHTGWLGTESVIAAMSAADVLVVPKTDHIANRAGVATKMVEYLSMARAVVATSVGDMPLYLRHGHDALICRPDDPVALAGALRQLLNNADERQRLGANARQTAVERFDYRPVGRALDATRLFRGRSTPEVRA